MNKDIGCSNLKKQHIMVKKNTYIGKKKSNNMFKVSAALAF